MSTIEDTDTHIKRAANRKLVFAITAIVFGVLWLLRNLGVIYGPWLEVMFSWQMILLVVGLVGYFSNKDGNVGYLIMACVGGFWLLYDWYHWHINFWQILFPSILIISGVSVLLKINSMKKLHGKNLSSTDILDSVAIFGHSEVRITSQQFTGGRSTAIFGGSDVDLTKAELAPGQNVIDITNIFGGTTIIVPAHWNVRMEVTGVLGAFSDNRKNYLGSEDNNDKVLVLKGIAILGGGEIKAY